MEQNQITEKLIEHSETLSRLGSSVCALNGSVEEIKRRSEEHGRIVESIHELALSVRELSGKVADVDGRLAAVEHERKETGRSVWQIVFSAVMGGVATYLFAVLGGF